MPLADGTGRPVLLEDLVASERAASLARTWSLTRHRDGCRYCLPRDRPPLRTWRGATSAEPRRTPRDRRPRPPAGPLVSSPAYASTHPDDGCDPGSGLTGLQIVLIYVALPLGLMVLISLLAVLPSMARGPRYRPGLGWWAAPVWFNGPDDADSALRAVEALPPTRRRILGGGASARW